MPPTAQAAGHPPTIAAVGLDVGAFVGRFDAVPAVP